jgi:hypothetical protein
MPELDVVSPAVLPEPTSSKLTTSFNITDVTSSTLTASSIDLSPSWDQPPLEKAIISGLIIFCIFVGLFIICVVGVITYICC